MKNTSVEKILAKEKVIITKNNAERKYSKILISTGARVFVPPIKNIPKKKVFYIRTVNDAVTLKEYFDKGNIKSGLVVGASMVGIKAAELLINIGAKCVLADMGESIFPLSAMSNIAEEIHKRVREKGIELKFSSMLSEIRADGEGLISVLNGKEIYTDIVILCIGTRPNLDMISTSELVVNGGLVVNNRMETNISGVYGAGDCCAGDNIQSGEKQVIGLWASAGYQGRTAGLSIAGSEPDYKGNIVHNITHFLGMDFIGFGDIRSTGRILSYKKSDNSFFLEAVMDNDGSILCVNILDNYVISGVIKHYMMRKFLGSKEPISQMQKVMLLRGGLTNEIIERLEGNV